MNELKDCPFCGGKAELECFQPQEDWTILCDNCGAEIGWKPSEKVVTEAWNRRVKED